MTSMFFFVVQTLSAYFFFCTIREVLMGGRYFSAYFIMCSQSQVCVYMNEANPFICCYDISAVPLSNISSGVICKCYHLQYLKCHGLDFSTHLFADDLTCLLSWNLCCYFKTATLCSHRFIVEEIIITKFAKGKNMIHLQTFLIVLFLW